MHKIHLRSGRVQTSRRPRPWARALLYAVLVMVITSAGCGARQKSAAPSSTERTAELHRIAAQYAQDDNLDQAKAALSSLKLANPGQVLVIQAEQEANQGADRDSVWQLANLAQALGSRSPQLVSYLGPQREASAPTAPSPVVPDPPTLVASPVPATATLPPAPTATVAPAAPTVAPATSAPSAPTATAAPAKPRVTASGNANVRSGPGTAYPVIGQIVAGRSYDIMARNAAGDWWRVAYPSEEQAWVSSQVVDVSNAGSVAVAQNIPPLPPTAVPAPTRPAPTAAPAQPPAAPANPPAPANPGAQYVIKSFRLRPLGEGAQNCHGGDHNIWVYVEDAAGNRINGVRVHEVFTNSTVVTGAKGPGAASWDIYKGGGGQVDIVDDSGNRIGQLSRGMSSDWPDFDLMRAAGYCSCKPHPDDASCQADLANHSYLFAVDHYVYEVTYRRTY